MTLLRWPLPALLAWAGTWLIFILLLTPNLPVLAAVGVATAIGVLLSVLGGTLWRRLAIGAGFPLSLLLSGAVALPAWAWLAPFALILLVYPMNAWRDAPLFPTPAKALVDLPLHVKLKEGAAILDAGCGLGHGLAALHAAFPQAHCSGIEWSWPLRFAAALRCPWGSIRQGDMWAADWSAFNVVYLFQRPESMPRAVAKAAAQLKPGAWLVSLEFPAHELEPLAALQSVEGKPVWLYQAPFKRAK